ncbi:MAG: acylphosphatase [Candidatus Korarchaeota archaeon]|nr:acylphosphatase [Candidatus Korarchaeota archaeon]
MKRRLIIEGEKVQDIGYRMFLLNLAGEHDLTGFQARNVGKKAVEALYEGDDEAVRAFESDVREMMPEGARADRIHFEDYDGPVKDIERFRSHFMTLQLGKMIEVGLTMIQKQDETLEELRAFREESKQNQETMIQNQQLMIQKQDETLEELKGIRKDLKSILDRRLTALERDVALIKERLGIE